MSLRAVITAAAIAALVFACPALSGAWSALYAFGETAAPATPRAYALVAFKRQLDARGYSKGLVLEQPSYGDAMRNRVLDFQHDQALPATGRIGPDTSRRLFRSLVYKWEAYWQIPNHDECRVLNLESAFDPAATGYANPADKGLAQINLASHPDVHEYQAFDPRYAIPWAARWLRSAFNYFKAKTDTPWRAAIVAYNRGLGGALEWLAAGRPSDSAAGRYLALVLSRPC